MIRRLGPLALLLFGTAGLGVPPSANAAALFSAPQHVGFSTFGGAMLFDAHLGDYRWDTRPQALWGLGAHADWRLARLEARFWRTGSSQETGLLGESRAPSIRVTGFDLGIAPQLFRWKSWQTFASLSAGLLHLGYDPDLLFVDTGSGGAPVSVAFDPIDTWVANFGLGTRFSLPGQTTLGVAAEHSIFPLETAHRVDDVIVEEKEHFRHWALRLEFSRSFFSF